MIKIVLIRHGQTTYNRDSRFTGWTDVPLTKRGINEAKNAGRLLKEDGFTFDAAFTSVLKRAIDTTNIILKETGLNHIPIYQSWRLNERHYGALQGLNKDEMAVKFGEEQVHIWRRSYNIRPPPLKKSDKRWSGYDPKYKGLNKKYIPLTESLKDTVKRVIPCWKKEIVPLLRKRKKIIVSASHNSLRALVKYLDNMSPDEILSFTIPYGFPIVYELDDKLKPIRRYFLGDPKEVEKIIKEIEGQGKAKYNGRNK